MTDTPTTPEATKLLAVLTSVVPLDHQWRTNLRDMAVAALTAAAQHSTATLVSGDARTPMRRTALAVMDYCAGTPAADWSVTKIADILGDNLPRIRAAALTTTAMAEGRRAERAACAIIAHEHQAPSVLRAILDRALADAPGEGWQPIETAPKDGTNILVWGPQGHGWLVVGYDDEPEHPGFPGFPWITLDGPQYPEAAFSHWMPLPKPPVTDG